MRTVQELRDHLQQQIRDSALGAVMEVVDWRPAVDRPDWELQEPTCLSIWYVGPFFNHAMAIQRSLEPEEQLLVSVAPRPNLQEARA